MSGSGNKKKPARTQGWEEAGSEFYQESYPTDAELDNVLQRDPKHLATLLPSKQTRAVATTIRIRTNDNRTIRRQTSSRSRRESTVHRRTSTTADVQVSMLPDLSQNLSTEETIFEEIMQIKAMPVPMAQKREMKTKILNEPNLRLQGYDQFKWKRRKMWRRFQSRLKDSYSKVELWKGALKRIEGQFGTGVVSYFLFLKWLMYLNAFIFGVIFLFITLPAILLQENNTGNDFGNDTSSNLTSLSSSSSSSAGTIIVDLIQGTGFMEESLMYYGYYPNRTFSYFSGGTIFYYNFPLAYVCITLIYFGVSLILLVTSSAKGFRERLIEGEGQFYQYCNLVFGGWDFCIHNEKSATIKHRAIFNEIKGCLEAERLEEMRQNRTNSEKLKLLSMRVIVNLIVVCILSASGYLIYQVFTISRDSQPAQENFAHLFYEYLPSIVIVSLNIIVPFFFKFLITFEKYSPPVVVRWTLFRTVLLRLSSLMVLYATLYGIVHTNDVSTERVKCWETYVGQQIYKLTITDFATHILLTFLVNFPRSFVARHVDNSLVRLAGEQSFDLPKHTLDVVYSQTLCWLGCYYAPLLSLMYMLMFFVMFQVKKFACLVNSKPSTIIYRASRSNSMFMMVLLVSFVFALLPIAYSVSELKPSDECGPFKFANSSWDTVLDTFYDAPDWFQSGVFFLSTAGFAVPVLLVLSLVLYYYRAVNSANRHMVDVLKHQLVLEGHDKQFLLERLSKFIKHQQENQKRMRRVELMQDGDTNLSSN